MNIVIWGPPNSGKGTLCTELLKRTEGRFTCFAPGTLLRNSRYADIIVKGDLVDKEKIFEILRSFIDQNGRDNLIMDGFPRQADQIQLMVELGLKVDLIINLDVPKEVLVERMRGRLVHIASGRSYHDVWRKPKNPGLDDVTGEKLTARSDDQIKILESRIDIFNSHKEPMMSSIFDKDKIYFQKFHSVPKIIIFQGNLELGQIIDEILSWIISYR